jgi:hypothetical protein
MGSWTVASPRIETKTTVRVETGFLAVLVAAALILARKRR